jgi:hypothetical protein
MSADSCIEIVNKSKTFRKWTPCGNIYIQVAFKADSPDKIDYILIDGGNKEIDCGKSWLQSLADILTFSIRRIRNQHEADAIVKNMRGHRCNKYVPNKDHVGSCVDAIGQVLETLLCAEGSL